MPTSPVPLRVAAKELNVDVSTVRRWIRAGACTVRPGEPGRGHGAMVNVADLQRWRATHGATAVLAEEWQQQVAEAFLAFHRAQRHRLVGLRDAEAAAYLHDLFVSIAQRTGVQTMPQEMALLEKIARAVMECGSPHFRRIKRTD